MRFPFTLELPDEPRFPRLPSLIDALSPRPWGEWPMILVSSMEPAHLETIRAAVATELNGTASIREIRTASGVLVDTVLDVALENEGVSLSLRLPWSVNFWESEPLTEDDCVTGVDFATEEEARECYAHPDRLPTAFLREVAARPGIWVHLEGPGVHQYHRRPGQRPARRDNDDDWRQETAMQAGMAGGCDAYNDAMGWN